MNPSTMAKASAVVIYFVAGLLLLGSISWGDSSSEREFALLLERGRSDAKTQADRIAARIQERGFAGDRAGSVCREQVASKHTGSYYYKVESVSSRAFRGIRGVGTLPQVRFDPDRFYTPGEGQPQWQLGPLDRPSVYMGAANAEGRLFDAGLTWDRVHDAEGRKTFTDLEAGSDGRSPEHRFAKRVGHGQVALVDGLGGVVAFGEADVQRKMGSLRPNFGFRPFWRLEGPEGWRNPEKGSSKDLYFYPGEKFVMTLQHAGEDSFRLDIRLRGKVWQHFTETFQQEGFSTRRGHPPYTLKVVNALDQFYLDSDGNRKGNEGRSALPTRTRVEGGSWDQVTVLGMKGVNGPGTALAGGVCSEVYGKDTAQDREGTYKISKVNPEGGWRVDLLPPQP